MKRHWPIIGLASLVSLAGCHHVRHENCDVHSLYQDAGTIPSLKVPEGLEAPSTKNALVVPTLASSNTGGLKGISCLDKPPKYFADALPTPVPSKK